MAKLVQTSLTSDDGGCLVTWLPVDPRVKINTWLTLEGVEGWWKVVGQYATQDSESINRKWGLSLPKSVRTER